MSNEPKHINGMIPGLSRQGGPTKQAGLTREDRAHMLGVTGQTSVQYGKQVAAPGENVLAQLQFIHGAQWSEASGVPVWIGKLRNKWGWSRELFAQNFGVTERTIRRWEAGSVTPAPDVQARLMELYGDMDSEPPGVRTQILELQRKTKWTNGDIAKMLGTTAGLLKRWMRGIAEPGSDFEERIRDLYEEQLGKALEPEPQCGLFIDAQWLHTVLKWSSGKSSPAFGTDSSFNLYKNLPRVIAGALTRHSDCSDPAIVSVYVAAEAAEKQPGFQSSGDVPSLEDSSPLFESLRESLHYEVDEASHEDSVVMMLAARLLDRETVETLDVAVVLTGDQVFVPVLKALRKSGVRVAMASLKDSCGKYLRDPDDSVGVRDFDVIWLDDLLEELTCSHLRWEGTIKKIVRNRTYGLDFGFIRAAAGGTLFFCEHDLEKDVSFRDLREGKRVSFHVSHPWSRSTAGTAKEVRPLGEPENLIDRERPGEDSSD